MLFDIFSFETCHIKLNIKKLPNNNYNILKLKHKQLLDKSAMFEILFKIKKAEIFLQIFCRPAMQAGCCFFFYLFPSVNGTVKD